MIAMKAAEDEIRVGDRRFGAATIAGGSGIGSSGLRADVKRARGVYPGERAAAGACGAPAAAVGALPRASNCEIRASSDATLFA